LITLLKSFSEKRVSIEKQHHGRKFEKQRHGRKFRNMSSNEKFCLSWSNFEGNISSAFYDLKSENDFTDVTLACVDYQIEAHKVILAASSQFFKRILKKNPHSHPLIYMKGIKASDVEDVLKFMYKGEVSIDEGNLNVFLQVAEDLEVKGLVAEPEVPGHEGVSHVQPLFPKTDVPSATSKIPEQSSVQLPPQKLPEFSISGNNNTSETVKVEASPALAVEEKHQESGEGAEEGLQADDLHRHSIKLTEGEDNGKFKCSLCGKMSSNRNSAFIHVESIHFPGTFEYECDLCSEKFDTKSKRDTHRSKVHSKKSK